MCIVIYKDDVDTAPKYRTRSSTTKLRRRKNQIRMHYVCARATQDEVMWNKIVTKSSKLSLCVDGGKEQEFNVQAISDPKLQ